MTGLSVFAYQGTAAVYFILGLVFVLWDKTGVGLVFFLLGVTLLARTTDQIDSIAQEHPKLVWIPFLGILFISVFVVVVELVMPLV